jgi:hypothetical protein
MYWINFKHERTFKGALSIIINDEKFWSPKTISFFAELLKKINK